VNTVFINNGDVIPADAGRRDDIIEAWTTILEKIPTHHLEPLVGHVLSSRTDNFPTHPKDIVAAWNNRYEEDEGPPPEGMSWQRDENGHFTIPSTQNPKTGMWPFNCGTKEEAVEKNIQARDAWLASHGLTFQVGMKVTAENRDLLLRMAKEKKGGND
jgi:hypothetical protein